MTYAVYYGPSLSRGNCGVTLVKSISLSLSLSLLLETKLVWRTLGQSRVFYHLHTGWFKNAYRASFIFDGVNFLPNNLANKLNASNASYGRLDFARNWESSCLVNFLTFSLDL